MTDALEPSLPYQDSQGDGVCDTGEAESWVGPA